MKIKSGDTIKILAGRDVDKTSLVEAVLPKEQKAFVKGLNLVKKHLKKTTKHPGGGIANKSAAIHISNLALICPNCKKPTRIAIKRIDKKRYRICKRCSQSIDK